MECIISSDALLPTMSKHIPMLSGSFAILPIFRNKNEKGTPGSVDNPVVINSTGYPINCTFTTGKPLDSCEDHPSNDTEQALQSIPTDSHVSALSSSYTPIDSNVSAAHHRKNHEVHLDEIHSDVADTAGETPIDCLTESFHLTASASNASESEGLSAETVPFLADSQSWSLSSYETSTSTCDTEDSASEIPEDIAKLFKRKAPSFIQMAIFAELLKTRRLQSTS